MVGLNGWIKWLDIFEILWLLILPPKAMVFEVKNDTRSARLGVLLDPVGIEFRNKKMIKQPFNAVWMTQKDADSTVFLICFFLYLLQRHDSLAQSVDSIVFFWMWKARSGQLLHQHKHLLVVFKRPEKPGWRVEGVWEDQNHVIGKPSVFTLVKKMKKNPCRDICISIGFDHCDKCLYRSYPLDLF